MAALRLLGHRRKRSDVPTRTLGQSLASGITSGSAKLAGQPDTFGVGGHRGGFAPQVIVRPFYPGPGWYGYWGPFYDGWGSVVARPATGEIKFDTHLKDALVYVDGGYLGPVAKFKKFDLAPGNHLIELRDSSGKSIFNERVNVVIDKTIELRPSA